MKKTALTVLLLCLLPLLLFSQTKQPALYRNADPEKMMHWADSILNTLSLEEKIGQLFVLGVDVNLSPRNKEQVKKYIEELHIGGVLFSKGTASEQAELTNYCQSVSKIPLMVTLDGEWGLSMRLTDTPRFPRNMTLGAIQDDALIYAYGKEVGRQCRRMGIHVNFAPVLDVNTNENNPVIGTRSFGDDPETVARKAIAYARGLESEGILSVGKHFPGHGDTSEDSHKTLPTVSHTQEHLDRFELVPFKHYIDSGLGGIMVAHLNVPALDRQSGYPASLSPAITRELLQNKLGFNGLVFSDALEMKGASGFSDLPVRALLAGNDILLKPLAPATRFSELLNAVRKGKVPVSLIEEKCRKILCYKYILGLHHYNPIPLDNLSAELNSQASQQLIRKLYASAVTLLKNEKETIPFKNLDSRTIALVSADPSQDAGFLKMLRNYTAVEPVYISSKTAEPELSKSLTRLDRFNTVIVTVHSGKQADIARIQRICKNRNAILVFFTSPYLLKGYHNIIRSAEAAIIVYEDNAFTQEFAAQTLFGGRGAQGRLPVNIRNLFSRNSGIESEKTRLGYALPEETGMHTSVLHRIDTIVQEGIDAQAFPGCQVLIAHRGDVIYTKSFGCFDYSGTHQVQNSDVYDLASVTKVTATLPAVMKLNDNRQLQLNHRLSNYVPELKNAASPKTFTVQEALFHETGMPAILSVCPLVLDNTSYGDHLYQKKRDNIYCIQIDQQLYAHKEARLRDDLFSTGYTAGFPVTVARELYASTKVPDTIFTSIVNIEMRKNKRYLYSDLNFVLLQKAVENITQQPIDRYLHQTFYAPLGATSVTYRPLDRINPDCIAPTENDGLLRKQTIVGYPHDELAAFSGGVSGNAGLFANANDLAKLLQLYLNEGEYGGEKYISASTVQNFTRTRSSNSRRGLGFDKPDTDNPAAGPTCPEAPSSVYGHTGFTGTCFWVDPDNELIFIFLSNRVYPHRWYKNLTTLNIRPRIQSVMYEALQPQN